MAYPCKIGMKECNGCGLCEPEMEPCPNCGSDAYEARYIRRNDDEWIGCDQCTKTDWL